jgi:hypothetical protein
MAEQRVIVVGGGLGGLGRERSASPRRVSRRSLLAGPRQALAQRVRPGRHQRLQRGRPPAGLLRVRALRRDDLRRRLPRRPAPGAGDGQLGPQDHRPARPHGRALQPHAEGFRDLRLFGGSLFKRTHFAGATTGQQLLYALDEQTRRYESEGKVTKYEFWEFLWPGHRRSRVAAASASSRRTCGRCRSGRSGPTRSSWPPAAAGWSSARAPTRSSAPAAPRPAAIRPACGMATRDDPGPPDRHPRRRQAAPHERIRARRGRARLGAAQEGRQPADRKDIPEASATTSSKSATPSTATSCPATSRRARSSTSASTRAWASMARTRSTST